jgi:hypothetical protein
MNGERELISALTATNKWSPSAARRGLRAQFCCEYCGRDLLASVEDYKAWEEDHIVPQSAGGSDDDENIAIACRTCNYHAKRAWDPQSICGKDGTRDELIAAIRQYVAQKRTEMLTDVARFRCIVYAPESSSKSGVS